MECLTAEPNNNFDIFYINNAERLRFQARKSLIPIFWGFSAVKKRKVLQSPITGTFKLIKIKMITFGT